MNITLCNISKHYTLKKALTDVSVSFTEGKIHALLGENGAGKSTLASILSGSIQPTEGTILIDDKAVNFKKQKDALNKGIAIVQQRPLLASSITAKENILLGSSYSLFSPVQKLNELKDKWCPSLNLKSYVKDLGGNYRFYIALLKALLKNPKCLILDEPSAFLDIQERKALYTSLKELSLQGTNIIVITHSTAEAITYTDDVTVLKEGTLYKSYESSTLYKMDVIQDSKANTIPSFMDSSSVLKCFDLINASSRPKNRPVLLNASLQVNYGEITAVSGLKEAALDTLEDLVTGLVSSYAKGKAVLYDKKQNKTELNLSKGQLNTRLLRKKNISIVSSDRTFRASNPSLTIEQLLTPYTKQRNTYPIALDLIKQAKVNITPHEKASNLSGGMLQRLILKRELSRDPDFIILCNPLQGLDIASQGQIAEDIYKLSKIGKAVLIIGSEDFPLSLCSRVYNLESGILSLSYSKNQKPHKETVNAK